MWGNMQVVLILSVHHFFSYIYIINIIPSSLLLLAAPVRSPYLGGALHRPSLIILQFAIGGANPHPRPPASAAPTEPGIYIYNLFAHNFTLTSRGGRRLSWPLLQFHPRITSSRDICRCWCFFWTRWPRFLCIYAPQTHLTLTLVFFPHVLLFFFLFLA
jgi:hypothetical protein